MDNTVYRTVNNFLSIMQSEKIDILKIYVSHFLSKV